MDLVPLLVLEALPPEPGSTHVQTKWKPTRHHAASRQSTVHGENLVLVALPAKECERDDSSILVEANLIWIHSPAEQ